MEQRDKIRILMDALCLKEDMAPVGSTTAWSVIPTRISIWTNEEYKVIKDMLFEALKNLPNV